MPKTMKTTKRSTIAKRSTKTTTKAPARPVLTKRAAQPKKVSAAVVRAERLVLTGTISAADALTQSTAKTKPQAQRCAACKGGTVPSTYAGYRHCINAKCSECSRDVDAKGATRPADALTLDALPDVLATGQGRRWAAKVLTSGWTVATMPARDFALMASAISRRAVEALFDTSWTAIAKLRGFDPNAKKTRAPAEGSAGLGLTADAALVQRGRQRGHEPVPVVQRALVDDAHLVVRVDSLPVGSTFKTADDMRVGVRGWTGTVSRHGIGSTSVSGGRWDYIAPGAMVVPLTIATPAEVSA